MALLEGLVWTNVLVGGIEVSFGGIKCLDARLFADMVDEIGMRDGSWHKLRAPHGNIIAFLDKDR